MNEEHGKMYDAGRGLVRAALVGALLGAFTGALALGLYAAGLL